VRHRCLAYWIPSGQIGGHPENLFALRRSSWTAPKPRHVHHHVTLHFLGTCRWVRGGWHAEGYGRDRCVPAREWPCGAADGSARDAFRSGAHEPGREHVHSAISPGRSRSRSTSSRTSHLPTHEYVGCRPRFPKVPGGDVGSRVRSPGASSRSQTLKNAVLETTWRPRSSDGSATRCGVRVLSRRDGPAPSFRRALARAWRRSLASTRAR